MKNVSFVKGNLIDVDYLVNMVNQHYLCDIKVYSVPFRENNLYLLKCKLYPNICYSVLQSCLSFAKVTIVEEEEVFNNY